jgi:predicted DNA binding CopG/RHH family protein
MTFDVIRNLWYYLNIGGDVTLMTKDDSVRERKNFTLRLSTELSELIEQKAASVGLTQNSYINMILHLALKKGIDSKDVMN